MTTVLVFCRFAHFAATMLLFGASAFVGGLVPIELARSLAAPLRAMIGGAIVVSAFTALAWLGLEAAELGDGWADGVNPDILAGVLVETGFGHVWLLRLAIVIVMLGAFVLRPRDRLGFVAIASALLLGSLSLAGHAVMQSGSLGALHRLNDCLHLLAAGAWLGALPPFLLCLNRCDKAPWRGQARLALRRFSGVGHVVVALVVLTGIANVFLTLGRWPSDFTSLYQVLLAAKIAIVAAMIGMALFNRYGLAPKIASDEQGALRALRRNSVVEIALGACALALVSVFGALAPV